MSKLKSIKIMYTITSEHNQKKNSLTLKVMLALISCFYMYGQEKKNVGRNQVFFFLTLIPPKVEIRKARNEIRDPVLNKLLLNYPILNW